MKTRFPFSVIVGLILFARLFAGGNVICLDPGHGGTDPGTVGTLGLINEKVVNLNVAKAVKDSLYWLYSGGFNIGMTRTTDVFVELLDRAQYANTFQVFGADYFISIHHNSAPTNPCATQGTEVYHCRSDTVYHSGGVHREVDTLMGKKIYLRIVEQWDALGSKYTDRGLKLDCGLIVLHLTKMISCLTEGSFLCDTAEERLFADSTNPHTKQEAKAITRGFISYCDHAGIAQISNRYVNGDSGYLEIDNIPLESPVERNWSISEFHTLYTLQDFWRNGYYYWFHHWSHLTPSGEHIGDDFVATYWHIMVNLEFDFHIYRAYFTGGPYQCTIYEPYGGQVLDIGDTLQIVYVCAPGVDASSLVDVYLDRHNGRDEYPELMAQNVPYVDGVRWVINGPESDSCMMKIVIHDLADNSASAISDYPFKVVQCSHCGDANNDGSIDISDVVFLISLIFAGGTVPADCNYARGMGDANGDRSVDISDVVYLIAYVFSVGKAPHCQGM
jgi:N-acetylmuramoyl-L-alanine amidase